jgi:quinoprotein glucose dehydrogenase
VLPAKLGVSGAPGAIVTAGGLVFVGGGDVAFHAIDKLSGRSLWSASVGRRTGATPMTYRSRSGRQFVVIAVGSGRDASLMAFAL